MADNTSQIGSDSIATDDLSTLNGAASGSVKVQRVKVGYGVDGDLKDVYPAQPLPTINASYQANTTGTITTNASTIVATDLRGIGSATIQISGTYAGVTFTIESSLDGTLWTAIPFVNSATVGPTPVTSVAPGTNATAIYNVSPLLGTSQIRVRSTAYTSGTANVIISVSTQFTQYMNYVTVGNQVTLATGTNSIGAVYGAVRTTGGATPYTLISAASTNATLVKSGATTIYGIQATNNTTSNAFLKLYNLSAAPTVGTSVATKTLLLPANSTTQVMPGPAGIAFGTGLSFAITGAGTTADTTAVAAAQVIVNIDYN